MQAPLTGYGSYMVNTYSLYNTIGDIHCIIHCIHSEFTVFSLYLYSLYYTEAPIYYTV